jgi:hypothetical protein
VISHASSKAPSHYQYLRFRTARLARYDDLSPRSMIPLWQDPSFLSFHAIVNQSTRHPTRRHSLRCHRIRRHHTSRLTRHHTPRVLRAIVLTADILIDIVLVTSYCTTFHCRCRSQSYANHLTKLAIILFASSSPSYSSFPTCHRPHR